MTDAIIVAEQDIEAMETSQWYTSLVEDCKAIMTEAIFNSRWALVEGYHNLGERVVTDSEYKKWEQNKAGRVLTDLSKDTNIGVRDIYRSMQFYEKFPDLDEVPEGKNITWNKIVTKYLPSKTVDDPTEAIAEDDKLRQQWGIEPGQVWVLGDHRLMCGDAYNPDDIKCLLGDYRIDALITDPPYGIDYKPIWVKWDKSPSDFTAVIGDDKAFDPAPFLSYPTVVMFGANNFSNRLPLGGWICWDKRLDENKDAMFGSPFELAWFNTIHTDKKALMVRVLHGGVVNADSVEGNNEKRQHATQKPVAVMERIINSVTDPEEVIFDPFSGSGSTLLACENSKRICLAMEIDPKYVAVTLQRWTERNVSQPCQVLSE